MKLMKVCKFGGSSLCNAEQFQKVRAIVKSDPSRRYVVVSGMGKRFAYDQKITDALYQYFELRNAKENAELIFNRVCERYDQIIRELELDITLNSEYEVIRKHLHTEVSSDYILSRHFDACFHWHAVSLFNCIRYR